MKLALICIGILVIAGCQTNFEADSLETTTDQSTIDESAPIIDDTNLFEEEETELRIISQADLSSKNSREDCWVAYEGIVYDVTDWITQHPGGANSIIQHCGTAEQFETAFNRQHVRQSTSSQLETLREFTIVGALEQ